ncbi:hypothetical protein AN403_5954 [Pseudomonas fluorescens]|uniref:Uncharacterized protein n=1 Tax=Pseudomonas fluorescens TaxID=294 RepID=A0A0P8Z8Y8_PSEFL|nr:hypothetical protein AN403_5954 [Pseudomonas fluorescens]
MDLFIADSDVIQTSQMADVDYPSRAFHSTLHQIQQSCAACQESSLGSADFLACDVQGVWANVVERSHALPSCKRAAAVRTAVTMCG